MGQTAKIVINAEGNAAKFMHGVGSASTGMAKAMDGSLRVAANFTIVAAGLTRATKALSTAMAAPIRLAIEQERAESQLEAVLRSTGEAAELNAKQLKDMASELQGVTTFSDQAIISAENILLTFTNIGGAGGIFERTTETVLDMSAALGTDLKNQSIQVGKALNDPIKGVSALAEVGVSFTQDQRDMIKTMVESGDVMAAQVIILDELKKEFGGSAAAAAGTFGGALDQIGNQWDGLLESAGSWITQNEGVKTLIGEISDEVGGWATELDNLIESEEGQNELAEVMRQGIVGILGATQATTSAFGFLGEVLFDVITFIAELRGETIPMTAEQRALAEQIEETEKSILQQGSAWEVVLQVGEATEQGLKEQNEAMGLLDIELQRLHAEYKKATESGGDFSAEVDAVNSRLEALSKRLANASLEGEKTEGVLDDLGDQAEETAEQLGLLAPSSKTLGRELQEQRERIQGLLGDLRPAQGAFIAWSDQWQALRKDMIGVPWDQQIQQLESFGDALEVQSKHAASFKPPELTGSNDTALNAEAAKTAYEGLSDAAKEAWDWMSALGESSEATGEQLDQDNEKMREFAEEIARSQEAWERSMEAMANSSADAFSDIFENWSTGQAGMGEGFNEFGAEMKETLADALFTPMIGADSALQGIFESALKPVNQLGKAIGDKLFGSMSKGLVDYYAEKKAVELVDAAQTTATHAATSTGIFAQQAAATAAMMPALSAAATAALISTFGGAASAAALLPGLLASGAAAGKAAGLASAVPFADGGYITERTFAEMGEAGNELVLPLTRPTRARQLLSELPSRAPGILSNGGRTVVNNIRVDIVLQGTGVSAEDVADQVNEALGKFAGAF